MARTQCVRSNLTFSFAQFDSEYGGFWQMLGLITSIIKDSYQTLELELVGGSYLSWESSNWTSVRAGGYFVCLDSLKELTLHWVTKGVCKLCIYLRTGHHTSSLFFYCNCHSLPIHIGSWHRTVTSSDIMVAYWLSRDLRSKVSSSHTVNWC